MAVFKIVVSDPKNRKSYQLEVEQSKAAALVGKKIGDEFNGELIGLQGYTLQITGGTDKDGFPMHPALKGSGRKKLLLTQPPGFHPKMRGQRKRKMVCGNTISESIMQINTKVVKAGEKPLEQLVPKKPKEKEEKPKEEQKEAKPEKPKAEAKTEEKAEAEEKTEVKKEPEEAKKPEEAQTTKPEDKEKEGRAEEKVEKKESGGGEVNGEKGNKPETDSRG